jgi:chaperonin cofactor prefoldin
VRVPPSHPHSLPHFLEANINRYKVGDCFVSLPQPQVLELLETSTSDIDADVEQLKGKLEGVQEEMGELKKALYGRFGRSINLET